MNPVYTGLSYIVWFLSTFYLTYFILLILFNEDRLFSEPKAKRKHNELVSILVPAYNEEEKIAETIASLKRITYKNVEFIVINDGSKDKTSEQVRAAIKKDSRFRFIDRKQNMGKAASLNEGIAAAHGKFVVTIDADTVVEPGIIQKVLPYFEDEKTGAVTVAVRIKNPKKLIHKVLELEFIIGLSLFLKLQSFENLVFVTPGPFSVYRRSMLKKIGGFDPKSITEDLEIAYRIRDAGYNIANCMSAKVYTIIPPTFKGLYVQRRRWYTGGITTLAQHRKTVYTKRHGIFAGFMTINYTIIVLGIIVFLTTIFLSMRNVIKQLWEYQYTGFNFFDHIFDYHFDILKFSGIEIIGIISILSTFVLVFLGMYYSKSKMRTRKIGLLGYPFLFVLYQIWWMAAFSNAIRGKKVKWR